MTDALLENIEAQITAAKATLDRLYATRAAYLGTQTPTNGQMPVKGKGTRQRAPFGLLETTILDVLKQRPKSSNAQIRDAILKTGYPYSLNPMHISKNLQKLAKRKRIVAHGSGPGMTYSAGKGA